MPMNKAEGTSLVMCIIMPPNLTAIIFLTSGNLTLSQILAYASVDSSNFGACRKC